MSERTFLALCQAMVSELGLQGGSGPPAVTGVTGEYLNVVNWIADADLYVQNLWSDWNFLWDDDSLTILINTDVMPALSDSTHRLRRIDEESMVLYPGTATHHTPVYMDYPEFRATWKKNAKTANARPTNWTLKPNGVIEFSHTLPAAAPVKFEYWRWPIRMTANADVSAIPESMDRIIICRAKITYAEREDAPEIMSGAAAEYGDLLEKMESYLLPGLSPSRSASSRPAPQAYVE